MRRRVANVCTGGVEGQHDAGARRVSDVGDVAVDIVAFGQGALGELKFRVGKPKAEGEGRNARKIPSR